MENVLRLFRESSLYDACLQMLNHLHVAVNEVTKEPIPFVDLYKGTYAATLPIALQEVLDKVSATYYIGNIDATTLTGHGVAKTLEEVNAATQDGKYEGMMVFAVEVSDGKELTRQESTVLTRAFNRIASAQPVILFIRQGKYLSLSTCERMKFSQEWRNGSGEKLGKVSILRNIDCEHPHRGHLEILDDLGDNTCSTFDELYKHWMDVFSNELLTKKFYTELSNWYAWAVQVARFPNDLTTNEDDEKFNHEACIRLITRLIFVWFLKQKHLIPDAFFDEKYIREHFIENFDPHDRKNLYYDTEKSKYYRLILQNLFFAMLNRPIVAEGKDEANNRRFRSKVTGNKNWDYNINNLMRYEGDFMPGGAEQFLQLANSSVPFLNGGLFECLDDKPNKMYYDGFSELDKSLEQLFLPDYLFFGDEVGASIDLSKWYGDKKKKSVSAQGIIDILRHYCFTVEENTPYDQEVSLDPELLGKAFENLLAAYNPETQTSARKQTGSFYTPREIVQYMVNESLVAHLKRICGEQNENLYRQLLSYSSDDIMITDEQSEAIMKALYNCRVLDPACGSGAFPMGVLQQMVHVLKRIDPTNEKWKDFMIDRAIEQSKKAFNADSEAERKERLADIESAFNQSVNDPDYARKLYLIEHCIYGVDIQPIATQISKLRFFISLVVDQRPTTDAAHNFGIRPLPNLEAKFVSANTLIPIEYDSSLVDSAPDVIKYKEKLKELNHKIFLARRNIDKQSLKKQIKETRQALADAIEATGFVSHGAAEQLAGWDMFDQNSSSSFFDPEWMFGVKGGFDIVIANPPYKIVAKDDPLKRKYEKLYQVAHGGKRNLYHLFFEKGIKLNIDLGVLSYITPDTYFSGNDTFALREFLVKNVSISRIIHYTEKDKVFDNVTQAVAVVLMTIEKASPAASFDIVGCNCSTKINYSSLSKTSKYIFKSDNSVIIKMKRCAQIFSDVTNSYKGDVNLGLKKTFFANESSKDSLPLVRGIQLSQYGYVPGKEYCLKTALSKDETRQKRIVLQEVANMGLKQRIKATILSNVICGDSCNLVYSVDSAISNEVILAILNSKAVNYYFKYYNQTNHVPVGELRKIPFPSISGAAKKVLEYLVGCLLRGNNSVKRFDYLKDFVDIIVFHLYGLEYTDIMQIDADTDIGREEYEAFVLNNIEKVLKFADSINVEMVFAANVNSGIKPICGEKFNETPKEIFLDEDKTTLLYEWILRSQCVNFDAVKNLLTDKGMNFWDNNIWKEIEYE